jgi:hypothetical protein
VVEVCFASGFDVLAAYWGHLRSGGLVIASNPIPMDEVVCLAIRVESSGKTYQLTSRRVGQDGRGREVFAFAEGQPADLLVSDALAETDNVPARANPRYPVKFTARVSTSSYAPPMDAIVSNLSEGGLCLEVEDENRHRLGVGTVVIIKTADRSLTGEVVWLSHKSRGVRFDGKDSELARAILNDMALAAGSNQ